MTYYDEILALYQQLFRIIFLIIFDHHLKRERMSLYMMLNDDIDRTNFA